jgi:hypothetical protein
MRPSHWKVAKSRPAPPEPHYQSLSYNPLNGGIARHFRALRPGSHHAPVPAGPLRDAEALFARSAPGARYIEAHQFRILAERERRPAYARGLHRDGVDRVLVQLVARDRRRHPDHRSGGQDAGPDHADRTR